MKQQQHQSIHALSSLESQDLSGYLMNNQTTDLMNKLSTVVSLNFLSYEQIKGTMILSFLKRES